VSLACFDKNTYALRLDLFKTIGARKIHGRIDMLRRNLGKVVRLGKWFAFMLAFAAIAMVGDAQPAKTDQAGDPLPAGALARMGTLRWRHGDIVSYVAFTPDGKAVLTATNDNTFRLWDRETGKEIRRFDSKAQPLQPGALRPGVMVGWTANGRNQSPRALSPDGKVLAVVLLNNAIQFWNVETGKEIRHIKGPRSLSAPSSFRLMANRSPDAATIAPPISSKPRPARKSAKSKGSKHRPARCASS
jgi:WD40 repeat protein